MLQLEVEHSSRVGDTSPLGVAWYRDNTQLEESLNYMVLPKKGNVALRALLVHGARSALQYADKKNDRVSVWATKLKHEKSFNKACVALANKLARIVWAVITHNKPYQLKEA